MKKAFTIIPFLLLSLLSFSQQVLEVQSNSKGQYLVHTVQPKENFYSVGRLFAVSPKEIAAFNGLDMTAGLSVGQQIQIPLSIANFSQVKTSNAPVYYVVGEKEGLYRVSLKNNKVLMANLRKWNNLKTDNISTGQKLIIGYLQGGEGAPAVAAAKPAETTPATTQPAAQPKSEPVAQQPVPAQPTPQRTEPTQAATTPKPTASTTKPVAVSGGAGYFKTQFDQQSKTGKAGRDATVTSGIFKTTSGFQDAKYYALLDKVDPGTIVQVVNPANNKSIYAKVLGEMSGIRQNQGLELRISNAAATALDISEQDKFIVRVLY